MYSLDDDEKYQAFMYALYMLAQYREKRAYPLIVEFFSIPGEITLDMTGDFVTQHLGQVLASVSRGDTSLMKALVENENANEWVRDAAIVGLMTLLAEGEQSRRQVMMYLKGLYRGKLARRPSYVWAGLVSASCDLYPVEVVDDIERAYDDELVDEGCIDLEWVQETLAWGKERTMAKLRANPGRRFISDAIAEMSRWGLADAPSSVDMEQDGNNVGRNEPCPCGSGRKYKKCCGASRRQVNTVAGNG